MFKTISIITGHSKKIWMRATWYILLEMLANTAPILIIFAVMTALFRNTLTYVQLGVYTGLIIVAFVVQAVFSIAGQLQSQTQGASIMKEVRLSLGEHLRNLPMGFFARREQGDISHVLLNNVDEYEMILTHLFNQVIGALMLPLLSSLFLLWVDFRLAIAVLISVPLAIPVLLWSQRVMQKRSQIRHQGAATLHARILEYIQSISLLKSHNMAGISFTRLNESMKKFRDQSISLEAFVSPLTMLFSGVLELGFVVILLAGSLLLVGGELDGVSWLVFIMISMKFYQPLRSAGASLTQMKYMAAAGERIKQLLEETPLAEPTKPKTPTTYDITFNQVQFRYEDKQVLHDISFHIPEKGMVALVGSSGAGKSTISHLLMRFWDVSAGTIQIGDVNISDIHQKHLLAKISHVQQQPYLFNETIASNIAMGKKEATREEIIEAAKAACCHDFIITLPLGYDTLAGEAGSALSGGEKQRISIARAILKDSPIIILDEATASLDPENELLLQQAIHRLAQRKTVLIIAHRLKTVIAANEIIVMNQGRIIQSGNHEQLLLEPEGLYYRLWTQQQTVGGWKVTR